MFLFKKNKIKNNQKDNIDILIETLLLLLENLGLFNYLEIQKKLNEKFNSFTNKLLYNIQILNHEKDYEELKEAYTNIITGYGPNKIDDFRIKLETLRQKNQNEFYNEAILFLKLEITRYESILTDLNSVIKRVKNNEKLTTADKLVLIDYWISFYKKEKLGFNTNITSEINFMINELKSYKYGGYGINEINNFKDLCLKKQIELEKKQLKPDLILESIKEIFKFFKTKYHNDKLVLEQKIEIITSSKTLSFEEKQEKIEIFIIDFKENHGHVIDLSTQLLELKQNLQDLKYGGYGANTIEKFITYSKELIIKEKLNNKNDKEILAKIILEYRKSITWYNKKIAKLEIRLNKIKDQSFKDELIKDFKEELDEPIDLKKKINKLVFRLHNSNNYTIEEINDFLEFCNKIEQESLSTKDIDKLVNILELEYERLILAKTESLQEENKNLEVKVKHFSSILSNLQNQGYGKNAIEEFNKLCQNIIATDKSIIEKNLLIEQKFKFLEDNYYNNLKIFTIWKNKQIARTPESKESIENEVKYLLSLSPKKLQEFYMNDSLRKKEAMEIHNKEIIIKHLAKKEAMEYKNPEIIKIRMREFANNIILYKEKDLQKAKFELENQSLLANEFLPKEDRLMTTLEYLNSTIFKQILNIRLHELQK